MGFAVLTCCCELFSSESSYRLRLGDLQNVHGKCVSYAGSELLTQRHLGLVNSSLLSYLLDILVQMVRI